MTDAQVVAIIAAIFLAGDAQQAAAFESSDNCTDYRGMSDDAAIERGRTVLRFARCSLRTAGLE